MQRPARISKLRKHPGFGEFLRRKREKHRLTQEDVGEIVGMRQRTVSSYEAEDVVFAEEQIVRLAEHVHEDPAPWQAAAGYGPAPAPPPADEPFPDQVSEDVVEYQATVRVDKATGAILEIKPIRQPHRR